MTNRSKDNDVSTSAGGSDLTGRSDTVMCQAIVPQLSHTSMPSEEET